MLSAMMPLKYIHVGHVIKPFDEHLVSRGPLGMILLADYNSLDVVTLV